ncbi:transcriptional regulator [Paraburkholderia sp. GAS82]|uniref:HVO_A0114 family putative DNA-binding protein n=1 Tax=Paraburkholderia sp. GAS82 TaxID=3035137 RepID=UPI003D1DA3D3
MRTVNIGVEAHDVSDARFVAAMKGEGQGEFITFESVHALLDTLTPARWHILMALAGRGPRYAVEVHESVGRPLAEVCEDVRVLVERGVVDEDSHGCVVFPYEHVRVGFEWLK